MKNLLTYTGPNKKFDDKTLALVRIQIDNSLDLGWKKNQIILVTDFPFEYNDVKSFVIEKDIYYPFDIAASKSLVLVYLLNHGLIENNELYWCHDIDAFENFPIKEAELGLENYDLGLTHYSYKPQWQFGSVFFKEKAKDILELLDQSIKAHPHSSRNNEKTLTHLIRYKAIKDNRFKRMNVTYNIMKRYIERIYPEAKKPLRVLHFNPPDKDALMTHTALEMFMYGKNSLRIPLMDARLIRIFNYHGIK